VSVHPSDAGRRTALLTRMLGSRQAFVDLFGGDLLPALRALRPENPRTDMSYPDRDGVVLGSREGVLTFEGFVRRAPSLDSDVVRDRVDAVLQAGVLRRGLVLQCSVCEQKQFQTIDAVGQRWACSRCGAENGLNRRAWKKPVEEPIWFYDLHPVGRQVLAGNGDVPALLAAYLAARPGYPIGFPPYQDVEEIEFRRGGDRQAEADLIAYWQDTLMVAECKSSDHLAKQGTGARAEVIKKCRIVQWLRADDLLFATTAPTWSAATRTHIEQAVRSFDWGQTGPPRVYVVTGLTSDAVTPNEPRMERLAL
jgi:hypothetical protein